MSEEKKESKCACKECLKNFKSPIEWLMVGISLCLMAIFMIATLGTSNDFGVWLFFSVSQILLSFFVYFFVRRNVIGHEYFAFNDKLGNLHFHAKAPMFSEEKQTYFSPSLIQDNKSSFDDMVISGPILRLFSGGWFRKNKILGVRSGNPNFYHASYAIEKINLDFADDVKKLCVVVEFNSNGLLVRTPWLDLNNALQVIAATDNHELYRFVIEPDRYFVHMDSYKLMEMQAKNYKQVRDLRDTETKILLTIIRDATQLIASWRGAEQSKVGMGARCFLETTLEAMSKHPPSSAEIKSPDELIKKIREEIALKSETNQILKRFVQGDERYKAVNPPAAVANG